MLRVIQSLLTDELLTQRQRWAHFFTVGFALLALFIGANLRDNALFATEGYINSQAGITAQYPRSWLRDESTDYIFRVRDVAHPGFQTTIQIAIQPVSQSTTDRSIRDALTLNRAQYLMGYDVLSEETIRLPDETSAMRVLYTYTYAEPNPFLQGIPVSVQGVDIITIRRGQVIIITFISDARAFDQNMQIFERFINELEF
jgi:hypothetical protein